MKAKYILLLAAMLVVIYGQAQVNILQPAGIRYANQYSFVEDHNSYYVLQQKHGPDNINFPNVFRATQYVLVKINKYTNQIVAQQPVAGDTTNTDSVVNFFYVHHTIVNNKISILFTKTYLQGGSIINYQGKFVQLDTNLNITIPEKDIPTTQTCINYIVQAKDKGILLSYISNIPTSSSYELYSEYIFLDSIGNIVTRDTIGIAPNTHPYNHNVIDLVNSNNKGYLVLGNNILGDNSWLGFYLADSNMQIVDTFRLKTDQMYYKGDLIHYQRRINLLQLPSGGIISSALFATQVPTGAGFYPVIAKHGQNSRYAVDTFVVFGAIDSTDYGHFGFNLAHFINYNRFDNSIYCIDATHRGIYGDCKSSYNYVEVMRLDTNLHTIWRKYIYFGPDSCATGTNIATPYQRSGVIVQVGASAIPQGNSLGTSFDFYIDSTGNPLPTGNISNIHVRDRITIYPNPATDKITIDDVHGALAATIIYNTSGQKVLHQQLMGNKQMVLVETLPPGLYFVVVKTKDGETVTFKLMRQ